MNETTKTDVEAIAEAQIEFLKEKIDYAIQADQYVVMHDTSASGIRAELQRLVRELAAVTAERDALKSGIETLRAKTVSQGVHDQMIELYNRAIDERDALKSAYKDIPELLDKAGWSLETWGDHYGPNPEHLHAVAAKLRAALGESESAK